MRFALQWQPSDRVLAGLVLVQVFVGGAAVMSLEFLASRLVAPVFGSTLYVWGSLIGVVMTGLALGAWMGGRVADERPRPETLSVLVFGAGLAVLLLASIGGFALDLARQLNLSIVWGPLIIALVLVAPPTFLLGMATPYAVRLRAHALGAVGNTTGGVSAISTVGSIVGTFGTVFVLLPRFGVQALLVALSITLLVVAIAGMRQRVPAAAVAAALLVLAPVSGNAVERALASGADALAYETLEELDTPYHHIEVLQARSGDVRHLVMDGLKHSSTFVTRPNETPTQYVHYFHLAQTLQPNLSRVLFIGAGGFSGPKAFLAMDPDVLVDVVEIDEQVVRVAEEHFFAPVDDPRVQVFVDDGRRYLAATEHTYDLIVLDAYGRDYVPFHLMTAEFFFEVRDRLAPGGVVVSNIIASTSGPASDILAAEVKTMEQAFREVYLFPVGGARGVLPQNVLVVASDDGPRLDADAFVKRSRAFQDTLPRLPDHARHLHEGLDTYGAPVLRDDFAPVEMLLNPVTMSPFGRG